MEPLNLYMEMSQQQKHFWPPWRLSASSQLFLKPFQANNVSLDFSCLVFFNQNFIYFIFVKWLDKAVLKIQLH